jgi:hypothetical protein
MAKEKPTSLGIDVMTGIQNESNKFMESIRKANEHYSISKSDEWYEGCKEGYELGLIQMHLNIIKNESKTK